jgi:hypothetical protein
MRKKAFNKNQDKMSHPVVHEVSQENRYSVLAEMGDNEGITFGIGKGIGRGRATKRHREKSSPTVGHIHPSKKQQIMNDSRIEKIELSTAEDVRTSDKGDTIVRTPDQEADLLSGSDFW